MMIETPPMTECHRRSSSFFRETRDLPRFDQHGFVSRHVSEKGLDSAWQARVRYHDMRGRPLHSKRVLEWNGLYVLYDLHLPPGASLPASATSSISSVGSTTSSTSFGGGSEGEEGSGSIATTSACRRRTVFRSNGGLVSPNGRYTFVQHNDNELVIYDAEGGIIWSCPGAAPVDVRQPGAEKMMNTVFTEFQHDGTLVQYAEGKKGWGLGREELWRSHTGRDARGDRLVMQDDGNLVIYNSKTSGVVWESGTAEEGGPNRTILR